MISNIAINIVYNLTNPFVMNWGYLENWKSTASD